MHDSIVVASANKLHSIGNRHQGSAVKSSNSNSTKPATNIINENSNIEEPVPSFLKALTTYQSEISLGVGEENDILNDTFSKSSANNVEDRVRYSDITSKSLIKSQSRLSENVIYAEESQALVLESIGDSS